MNSLDERVYGYEPASSQLRALREENARLKGQTCERCGGRGVRVYPDTTTWRGGIGGQMMTEDTCSACWGTGRSDVKGPDLLAIGSRIATLTRERDEARSAEAKARDESDLRDRLLMSIRSERDEARKQLTCIDLWLRRREPVVRESATLRSVQEFIERAEAEVARLEGLILAGREALALEIEADARGVSLCKAFDGGPLAGASVYNVMMWAVRRIRAQRELPTSQPARAIEVCKRAQREEGK